MAGLKLDPTQTGHDAEKLYTDLHKWIIGQDEAIAQVVNVSQMHLVGMNSPSRAIGNLLFLGPRGSGKTRLAEATAESLVGDARVLIKIDCAEFQHSHEIAKLIGSPPGYLGHRETHPLLSQEMLNLHHTDKVKISFVLFDEIEKASDALWNLLLGILDKATLTLGDNCRVDFSCCLIFMTTNPFVFSLTEEAKDSLLQEGTDMKYGARHLKRAIDRALVHPISNLIASQQVRTGDLIKVDFDPEANQITFAKEAEDLPASTMAQMMESSVNPPTIPLMAGAARHPVPPPTAAPPGAPAHS